MPNSSIWHTEQPRTYLTYFESHTSCIDLDISTTNQRHNQSIKLSYSHTYYRHLATLLTPTHRIT